MLEVEECFVVGEEEVDLFLERILEVLLDREGGVQRDVGGLSPGGECVEFVAHGKHSCRMRR